MKKGRSLNERIISIKKTNNFICDCGSFSLGRALKVKSSLNKLPK